MVTITLRDEAAAYVLMVMQARADAATQRELHAHSRGDRNFRDVEALLTLEVITELARTPRPPEKVEVNTNPLDLAAHPDYCAEHGGHLRDSPACETAKLAALRGRVLK